jgi:CheY-like chemotaxis protein
MDSYEEKEIIAFVTGSLSEEKARELERQAEVDPELAARIWLMRFFAGCSWETCEEAVDKEGAIQGLEKARQAIWEVINERPKLNADCLPCLVLAHPHPDSQAVLSRGFRRLGWDVYVASSGPEARRLARMLEADIVILHVDLPEESGWLTCDKLTREQPLAGVILISDDLSPRNQELADFVGAGGLLHENDVPTLFLREFNPSQEQAAS